MQNSSQHTSYMSMGNQMYNYQNVILHLLPGTYMCIQCDQSVVLDSLPIIYWLVAKSRELSQYMYYLPYMI